MVPIGKAGVALRALDLHLAVGGLSPLFLLVINPVALCCAVYATDYLDH